MNNPTRKQSTKMIEKHLRNYKTYKIGVSNLQKQLDHIMPSMTASYDISEGTTGTFNIKSDTENFAIDRIESKRALMIHEDMAGYQLIIDTIDEAMKGLDHLEKQFINLRYFEGGTITQTAVNLGYSENRVFEIRNIVLTKLLISLKGLLQYQ